MTSNVPAAINSAFRDYVTNGVASSGNQEPVKSEVRAAGVIIGDELDAITAAQAGGLIAYGTWAALAARTTVGLAAGFAAKVFGPDTGTHTDPVVGGTVANKGIYSYSTSPAGWRRIANLEADDALTSLTTAREVTNAALLQDRNLFDKLSADTEVGYVISGTDSTLSVDANYLTTHFIEVIPGGNFVSNYAAGSGFFFDDDQIALVTMGTFVAGGVKAVPAGAYYVRFSVAVGALDYLYVTEGSAAQGGYRKHGVAPQFPHQDLRVFFLGDSQTYNEPSYKLTVAQFSGVIPDWHGVPGWTMADGATALAIPYTSPPNANYIELSDQDRLVVVLGTNDWSSSRALGTIADGAAVASFYGDMAKVIDKAYGKNAAIEIMFVSPAPRGAVTPLPASPPGVNSLSLSITDYRDAMAAFCDRWSLPFCDLIADVGFNIYNIATKTVDGLHWSTGDGAVDVGRLIAARINET